MPWLNLEMRPSAVRLEAPMDLAIGRWEGAQKLGRRRRRSFCSIAIHGGGDEPCWKGRVTPICVCSIVIHDGGDLHTLSSFAGCHHISVVFCQSDSLTPWTCSPPPSPAILAALVEKLTLSRVGALTCPVRCGVVFGGVVNFPALTKMAPRDVLHAFNAAICEPHVSVFDGLDSSEAVECAADEGRIPPIVVSDAFPAGQVHEFGPWAGPGNAPLEGTKKPVVHFRPIAWFCYRSVEELVRFVAEHKDEVSRDLSQCRIRTRGPPLERRSRATPAWPISLERAVNLAPGVHPVDAYAAHELMDATSDGSDSNYSSGESFTSASDDSGSDYSIHSSDAEIDEAGRMGTDEESEDDGDERGAGRSPAVGGGLGPSAGGNAAAERGAPRRVVVARTAPRDEQDAAEGGQSSGGDRGAAEGEGADGARAARAARSAEAGAPAGAAGAAQAPRERSRRRARNASGDSDEDDSRSISLGSEESGSSDEESDSAFESVYSGPGATWW